jgi:tetratricopeptide (TPR) repeat protein
MNEPANEFLDVPTLLERSLPRPRQGWLLYAAAGFFGVVILSYVVSSSSPQAEALVRAFSSLVMIGLIAAMAIMMMATVRRHRSEQQQLEAVEELIQLRRWSDAAVTLNHLLSSPTRSPHTRATGLLFLTSVLARYHRFTDAITVQNHLIDDVLGDPATLHALRLGRAMAMLREDHLFDADRAISELRRDENAKESAGLALIEIYRDVKTGHPQEAIEMYQAKLPLITQQMGIRVADAHVLAAKAFDLLGRQDEAQQAYRRATLLAPVIELQRRYPEVKDLAGKYESAAAPAGAL